MLLENRWPDFRKFWFVLGLIIVSQFFFSNISLGAGAPLVYTTVFNVDCFHLDNFTTTFQKIADMGTFTLNSSGSIVDVNDRPYGAITRSLNGATS
jgi:hypothetical protein